MSSLPTVRDFAKWLESAQNAPSEIARSAAMANSMVAYARCLARTQGCDEHAAALEALTTIREVRGEEAAYASAAANDLDLDMLLDAQREENEEKQREVELERDVPWGREHR